MCRSFELRTFSTPLCLRFSFFYLLCLCWRFRLKSERIKTQKNENPVHVAVDALNQSWRCSLKWITYTHLRLSCLPVITNFPMGQQRLSIYNLQPSIKTVFSCVWACTFWLIVHLYKHIIGFLQGSTNYGMSVSASESRVVITVGATNRGWGGHLNVLVFPSHNLQKRLRDQFYETGKWSASL